MENLNQSFFLYIREYLLIEFLFFLLDHLFLFLGLGLLDHDIQRIFFLIIDLELLFGIEKIISDEFGDICQKS
jgi:hypothetical protein